MSVLYQFLTGYFFWISFSFLICGLIIKMNISFHAEREQNKNYFKKFGTLMLIRPLINWFLPWFHKLASGNYFLNFLRFSFRLSLCIVPVFLLSHNLLWKEFFGWHFFAFQNLFFDAMTIIVISGSLILIFQNILKRQKKKVVLLSLIFASFLTGMLARYQIGDFYEFIMVIHIVISEILMFMTPFVIQNSAKTNQST